MGEVPLRLGIDIGRSKTCVSYYSNGTAKILTNRNGERVFSHENCASEVEICTSRELDVLIKIRNEAKLMLGQTVDAAVLAVPTNFTQTQTSSLLRNATAAGFADLEVIDASAAAALAFHTELKIKSDCYCFVLDFGVTCKAAIVQQKAATETVVSFLANAKLSSCCFTDTIITHVCHSITHGISPELTNDVMTKCESAKKILSTLERTTVIVEESAHDVYEFEITRTKFERLCAGLFKQLEDLVDECVQNAQISKKMIGCVVLAGGTTRIPKIRQLMEEYFHKKDIVRFINPEECVADGAAIYSLKFLKESQVETY